MYSQDPNNTHIPFLKLVEFVADTRILDNPFHNFLIRARSISNSFDHIIEGSYRSTKKAKYEGALYTL